MSGQRIGPRPLQVRDLAVAGAGLAPRSLVWVRIPGRGGAPDRWELVDRVEEHEGSLVLVAGGPEAGS